MPQLVDERPFNRSSTDERTLSRRSTRRVLEEHLRLREEGRVEEDLARNHSESVATFAGDGIYWGHNGARRLAARLARDLAGATFRYEVALVEGEQAFLEWTAEDQDRPPARGSETFVIRDGWIVARSIHYTRDCEMV